jgi:hypothetical protein
MTPHNSRQERKNMTSERLYVRSVQELIENIEKSGLYGQPLGHRRVWFRGQRKAGWLLKPGVYRDVLATKSETARLNHERQLTQDFRVQSAALRNGRETDEELYFLQQHYRMPTRLLDWTTSPLAALFFAVENPHSPEDAEPDGELFMMDATKLKLKTGAPREAFGRGFRGIATARHHVFQKAVGIISQWHKDKFPDFIIPVRPHYFDIRVGLQRSCFTYHVPAQPEITSAINETFANFLIPGAAKRKIRSELNILGMDAFRIYGDLEHLSETLRLSHGV